MPPIIKKRKKKESCSHGFMLLQIISNTAKCLEREGTQYQGEHV